MVAIRKVMAGTKLNMAVAADVATKYKPSMFKF